MRKLNSTDMSMWSGEFTPFECEAMWYAGVKNIKVGDGWAGIGGGGQYAREQAETWLSVTRDRGGSVDAYIYLYMANEVAPQINNALATLDGVDVRMWWLDAEDVQSEHLTVTQRVAFLRECIRALGGRRVGIYTAHWWWPSHMANSDAFSDLPLWNSWYDRDPDESGLPYGGWVHSAVEQYDDTQLVGGQSVDLNYDGTLEEDDMGLSIEQELRIKTLEDRNVLLERIVCGWGFTTDEGELVTNAVALKYIDDHQRSMYEGLRLQEEKVGEMDLAINDALGRISELEAGPV